MTARVGIVGGGILGMTLARRLRAAGHAVTVLEAAPSAGGLLASHELGGHRWDKFYHVVLPQDETLLALLDELGLTGELEWRPTRTGFFVDGQWHSLSTSWDYLRFPPLGLLDKARLALTILRAAAQRDGRSLESIPVGEWLERWSGTATYRRIWLPLLKSKLGDNYRQTSAAFIWSYIRRLYRARASADKRERLGYVRGGYARVLDRLEADLRERGVTIQVGVRVAEVRRRDDVEVVAEDGTIHRFDHVVLTVPTPVVARICPALDAAERARLGQVVYQGVVCLSVLTREPLAGYYVTNITDDWVPFTTVVEMTSLVDRAHFGGNSLLYLARYVSRTDPWATRGDAEITTEFLGALERMYPGFRRDQVLATRMARATDVQALSTIDYSATALPPLTTSVPGVLVLNTAQIVNGTLNVNETVSLVERHLPEIIGRLTASPTPALAAV